MRKKQKVILGLGVTAGLIVLIGRYLSEQTIRVLQPAGTISFKERELMFIALGLAVIVVVPTFALTIWIAVKYNEKNHTKKTKYSPEFKSSKLFESLWWGIPIVIIGVLSVITWVSAHRLDQYRPIASKQKPLTVDVVSEDWKWLFIYPDQHIASVNYLAMPVNRPVHFYLTSDSVMNSFWIPQLGGQMMTMPGMKTQLYLNANKSGSYRGWSANISGTDFARMTFSANAMTAANFNNWIIKAERAPKQLTWASYEKLAKPSVVNKPLTFSSVQPGLFENIIMGYMMPMNNNKPKANSANSGKVIDNKPKVNNTKPKSNSKMPMNMNMNGMKM